jgi:membrane associated rhomboid family serine protease
MAPVCYRHSDRQTGLRCVRCARPICDECVRATPAGDLCPDCLEELRIRMIEHGGAASAARSRRVQPRLTYGLLALIVVIFVLEELAGGSTTPAVLIRFGATYGPALFAGEMWRLFTAMFVHIGIAHIFFNGFALYSIGREVEAGFGHARFAAVYFGAGLFGNVVSFFWRGIMEFSSGASGAIFGILGAELAFLLLHRQRLGEAGRAARNQLLRIIAVNIIIGVTVVSINNAAHMGGLVSGFVLGYLLAPRFERTGVPGAEQYRDRATLARRWWVAVAAVVLIAAGAWGTQYAWTHFPDAMLRVTSFPRLEDVTSEEEGSAGRDWFDLLTEPTPTPAAPGAQVIPPALPARTVDSEDGST